MKRLVVSMITAMMVVSACGNSETDEMEMGNHDELAPLEVQLNVPEQVEVGEEVQFESIVTQGESLVDDADEVVYEVWLEGQKEASEMIEATDQEDNHYTLTHSFEEDGIYHVQTHVTARGLHTMPTSQIKVGEVKQTEEAAVHKGEDKEHAHEESHDHHHQHADVEIDMEKTDHTVVFFIKVDDEVLENGVVTIEMMPQEGNQHIWLDTNEVGEGKYELKETDDYSGQYDAIIHIERDEDHLHEHTEVTLDF
ncbi:FixH family protein [Alkalihalophilus sp. As8PL]|uniref:FixH family protein n=1 Tax=Alkalihalophilus sp. As8PL TaxID=3237103 RepID=A0AB39BTY7_9BACI